MAVAGISLGYPHLLKKDKRTRSEKRNVLGDKQLVLQESHWVIHIVFDENMCWLLFSGSVKLLHFRKGSPGLISNWCCRILTGLVICIEKKKRYTNSIWGVLGDKYLLLQESRWPSRRSSRPPTSSPSLRRLLIFIIIILFYYLLLIFVAVGMAMLCLLFPAWCITGYGLVETGKHQSFWFILCAMKLTLRTYWCCFAS